MSSVYKLNRINQQKSQEIERNKIHISLLISAVDKFIKDADITLNSKSTYIYSLQSFFNWLHEKYGEEFFIDREHIILYKQFLEAKGLKPYTRALYMVAVRRFFEWSESILLYPNIAKGIKVSKGLSKTHNKDSLTKEMAKKLLHSIDQSTIQGKRDYALIYLLLHTGLRLIEITRAFITDIEFDSSGKYILYIHGKGKEGKDDFVILVPKVFFVLSNFIKARGLTLESKEPLFCSVSDRNFGKKITVISLSRAIKETMEKAGIKNKRISAHSLRHTFGVIAIKQGASLYEVQLALRHMSPHTTQVYLGDIEKEKRLQASAETKVSTLLEDIG